MRATIFCCVANVAVSASVRDCWLTSTYSRPMRRLHSASGTAKWSNDKTDVLGDKHRGQSHTARMLWNELTESNRERLGSCYEGSLGEGGSQLIDQRKESGGGRTIIKPQQFHNALVLRVIVRRQILSG